MDHNNSLTYRVATTLDCDSLVMLVNNSYRGEMARQGWTNENEFIDGQRTTVDAMFKIINSSDSVILIFFDEADKVLKGCVHLQHKSAVKMAYIGMLTVRPDLQRKGYGKMILSSAEKYAINEWNVDYIEITVVLLRTELISFYNRRGYHDIGKREPFPPYEFGIPKRNDLEFCTMRKCVTPNAEKI
ncbi:hypothetical protein I4U23_022855 [Adineta vaga]|nr:hypothetical protein I4U23_022855 [Adineta vaga]